jgi:chitinase
MRFDKDSLQREGFTYYWDEEAKAPYMYSPAKKQFITYDDETSIAIKTKYAMDQKLRGIMFWQLGNDKIDNGLLSAIHNALH